MTANGSKAQTISATDLDAAASETPPEEPKAKDLGEPDDADPEPGDPGDTVSKAKKSKDAESNDEAAEPKSSRRSRTISVSFGSLGVGLLIALLVAGLAVLGFLYDGARNQLHAQAVQSANASHAEKIALDYAVSAATMDYKDLQRWKVKLVQGTSNELGDRLTKAGTSMEQVLVPLQWSSSARPLLAKVRSNTGGIYVVDSFVSVDTKTIQAPDALQSTATYSITIDANNNWLITDVGGIGAALGPK